MVARFFERPKEIRQEWSCLPKLLTRFFHSLPFKTMVFKDGGIDQAHEQNNKVVKVNGGAIEILDHEAALLKWAVAGPIISKMIEDVHYFK